MRIGFEVSNVTSAQATGIARYAAALISALAAQLAAFDHLTLFYKLSRWPRRRQWWRPAGLPIRLYQGGWWPPVKGIDIIHGLDGIIPPWPGVQRVVTLYDLLVLRSPDTHIAPLAFRRKKLQFYRTVAACADAIITISATTKQDVIDLLGVPATQVYVTPLGLDRPFGQHGPEATQQVLQSYALV